LLLRLVPLPSSGDKFADETDNFRFFVPVSRSIECISLAAFGGGKVSVEDETDDSLLFPRPLGEVSPEMLIRLDFRSIVGLLPADLGLTVSSEARLSFFSEAASAFCTRL
jgi:hypothetical protein